MNAFLDTSVLIPVFYGDHTHHAASLEVFARCDKDGCCGAHSLAKAYAALTRMPGKHRISGEQTMLFIADIRERLSVIAVLDGDEYTDLLEKAAAAGIVGGRLSLRRGPGGLALKSGAESIFTWNVRHFVRFGPEVTRRVPGHSLIGGRGNSRSRKDRQCAERGGFARLP